MCGMSGDELLGGRDHRREPALHISRPASIEHAIAHCRHEGVASPFLERAGRHDIGVSCEAEHRPAAAPARPEVRHTAERHQLDHEADLAQTRSDQLLAALIRGRNRTTGNEIPSQVNGLRHHLQLSGPVRGYTAAAASRQGARFRRECAASRHCKVRQQHCAEPQGRRLDGPAHASAPGVMRASRYCHLMRARSSGCRKCPSAGVKS